MLWLVGVAVVALALHKILAYDVWWQIAAGEWIADHGFPRVDPFSYAYPGQPWIEPRWSWCLLAQAGFQWFGLNGLIWIKVLFLLAAFGLLGATGDRQTRWATGLGCALALVAAQERFMVRPELVSFVGLTATLFFLERYRRGGGRVWLWMLPLLQLVWSNAHTLWILGPATQWILLVGGTIQARLTGKDDGAGRRHALFLVACVSTLVPLLNPYGIRGWLFPFRLFQEIGADHVLGRAISEFHSPFSDLLFRADPRTIGFLAVIAISIGASVLNRSRLSWGRAALWVAFLVLAVRAHRNVALFGFVAGYTTIRDLAEWDAARGTRKQGGLPALLTLLTLVYAIAIVPLAATDRLYRAQGLSKQFGLGVSDRRFPVRALGFLREHRLPTPLIHSLGDGGYVLFEGGPGSVFIDGRLEVYGESNLREALDLSGPGTGLDVMADRTGAGSAIVRNDPKDRGLFRVLERAADWVPVYYDPLHVVYLRVTPATRQLATRLAIDWQQPPVFVRERPSALDPPDPLGRLFPGAPDNFAAERLGSLFAAVGNYERAEAYFTTAVEQDGRDPRAALMLGLILQGKGRSREADGLLSRVPAGFLQDPDGRLLVGQIHMAERRVNEAVEAFEAAIELGGFVPEYAEPLARAAIAAKKFSLARGVLDRLVDANPREPSYHNLLGVLALSTGRPAEAREHFGRSLELYPDQPRIRRMMPPEPDDPSR